MNSSSYCTGAKQVIDHWAYTPAELEPPWGWKPIGPDQSIKIVILDPHGKRLNFFYTEDGELMQPTGWSDPGSDHERGECRDLHFLHQGS